MKLICINDNWCLLDRMGRPKPFVGEECEAINSGIIVGELYYQLAGRFHENSRFHHRMFAVQSDINEKDFNRNYSKSLK